MALVLSATAGDVALFMCGRSIEMRAGGKVTGSEVDGGPWVERYCLSLEISSCN